jgi:hypothetical protein
MNRFSKADIETIRHMAARGFGGVEIAKRLGRTPQSIRVKCVELGVGLRPMPTKDRLRILFEPAFYDSLMREAKARATTQAKLARLLLVTLLSDNMVGAVLDVPVGKGKPIAKAHRRRARAVTRAKPVQPAGASLSSLQSPALSARIG